MDKLLSPYRVLDLTDEKGLLCGKMLGDMGADVIKVEKPGGDEARLRGPFYHDIPNPEKSLFWFAFNTNKRGITLNIETSDGQAILKKLAKKADFVIESYQPGYLDKLGLGYSALSQINPRIVMTSITPFGQTGPYAHYKASDLTTFAMGLLMDQCGDPDRPPVQVSFPQAYLLGSAEAAQGTMVAHYHRELTGEGQQVDVSIMESVVWSTSEALLRWPFMKINSSRPGRKLKTPLPVDSQLIWRAKDGFINYILMGGMAGAEINQKSVDWMAEEGMAPDELRLKYWMEWDWFSISQQEVDSVAEPLAKFFATHTVSELWSEALKRRIMLYPVADAAWTFNDPQLSSRDFWVTLQHDELNDKIRYPGPWAIFSETPMKGWRRAPLIGEHNEEIYVKELGLPKEQLIALKAAKII